MTLCLRSLRQFRRDQSGISAVEFALLAPFMIFLYFGMAEVCQAYMAQKRMSHVTSMVADLTAQAQSVSTNDLTDIFTIGNQIMEPFSSSPLQLTVASVTRDTNGVAKVDWSYARGMPRRSGNVVVPAGLINNGESLIISDAIYDYESPLDRYLPGVTKLKRTYYLRPRVVDKVQCGNCPTG